MANNESQRGGRFKDSAGMISAIAALITALVGLAVFLVDKGTGAETTPTAVTTATAVSTTSGTSTAQAAQQTTQAKPLPAGVQLDEEIIFGEWNLDSVPPRKVESEKIQALAGEMLYVTGKHVLAEWPGSGSPDKEQCAAQVSEAGFNQVDDLVKGSIVCGRTPEGRIFRLEVLTSGSEIRAHATVWTKK
ncbi:hypothetical protein [Actinokineospora pegani]|uniref:hypothetical protein n=1 Tax=Actinokineospora pegani TaxID=2654637 RepID=UPI0012EA2CE6|nr:hypothetical protein [Actinokineospora pegani]